MKLSHSTLSMVLNCPKSYYLSKIQGIGMKDTKPAFAVGSAVHYGIEHSTDDLTEYFNKNGGFKTRDNFGRDQLLAESMVFGYLQHKESLYEDILKDPVTGEKLTLLEEYHELFITGKLKSNNFNSDTEFVGIVDLLLLTNKGFIVVDYKTSSQEPDWNSYLEQIYRYVFLINSEFPDIPVVKIGIINLRKTQIRQKKAENQEEFLNRLRFEYRLNDEKYVNYHEYATDLIDSTTVDKYIENLSIMCDAARTIVENNLFFINYGATKNMYGKSDFYDIFYKTPGAYVLYTISDNVVIDGVKTNRRDCVEIDMLAFECADKLMNKFDRFYAEWNAAETYDKDEFFDSLRQHYITDDFLLELYWNSLPCSDSEPS